jgi:hypothetical protein
VDWSRALVVLTNDGVVTRVISAGFTAGSSIGEVRIGGSGTVVIGHVVIMSSDGEGFTVRSLESEERYRQLCRELDDRIASSTLRVCTLQQEIDRVVRQLRPN